VGLPLSYPATPQTADVGAGCDGFVERGLRVAERRLDVVFVARCFVDRGGFDVLEALLRVRDLDDAFADARDVAEGEDWQAAS